VVVIETLNVAGRGRRGGAHKSGLNRALHDAAFGRIRAQLAYKSSWYRTELINAPRFFASTQLCSRCGAKTKLPLRDRTYRCRSGCPPIDRDLNAAINLARLGDPMSCDGGSRTGTGSSPADSVTAVDGRGAIRKTSTTTEWERQEATKRQPRTPTRRGRQLRKEQLPEMCTKTNPHISGNGLEVGHERRV
jgi:putative transposase